nr:hypothetical protein [Tanacetum cinerariifolium]
MVPYDHMDHVIKKSQCSPFGNLEGKRVIFVGTYNGILLLAFKNQFPGHMMLYNPFTGESEMVPDPPLCDQTFTYNYGLGYATALDELKIFVLKTYNGVRLNGVDTCCYVFSFKDRSWSIISLWVWDDETYELWDDHYKYDFIHDASTFMNGFLYWPVIKCGFGRLLLALDLSIFDDGKIVMLKRPNQVMILDIFNDSDKEANTVTTLSEISGTQAIEYMETYLSPYDICSSLGDKEQDTKVEACSSLKDNEQDTKVEVCSSLEDNEQDTEVEVYSSLEEKEQDTEVEVCYSLQDKEQDTEVEVCSSLENKEQDTKVEVCSSLEDKEQDTEVEVYSSLEDKEQDTKVEVCSSLEDKEQDAKVEALLQNLE